MYSRRFHTVCSGVLGKPKLLFFFSCPSSPWRTAIISTEAPQIYHCYLKKKKRKKNSTTNLLLYSNRRQLLDPLEVGQNSIQIMNMVHKFMNINHASMHHLTFIVLKSDPQTPACSGPRFFFICSHVHRDTVINQCFCFISYLIISSTKG